MDMEIIKVSTKGQIAIPISMRKELSIETGDSLIAFAYGDTIMLKVIKLPSSDEFKKSLDEAQQWAKDNGLKESDINDFVKNSRKNHSR